MSQCLRVTLLGRPRYGTVTSSSGRDESPLVLERAAGPCVLRAARPHDEQLDECATLTRRQRADVLVLRQPERQQQPAAAGPSPAALAHQQIAQLHAAGLPRALEHDAGGSRLACGDLALQLGSGEPNAVRLLERLQVLRRSIDRGGVAHIPPRNVVLRDTRTTGRHRGLPPQPPELSPPVIRLDKPKQTAAWDQPRKRGAIR